eukprot:1187095-Rhodomonas_salina.1
MAPGWCCQPYCASCIMLLVLSVRLYGRSRGMTSDVRPSWLRYRTSPCALRRTCVSLVCYAATPCTVLAVCVQGVDRGTHAASPSLSPSLPPSLPPPLAVHRCGSGRSSTGTRSTGSCGAWARRWIGHVRPSLWTPSSRRPYRKPSFASIRSPPSLPLHPPSLCIRQEHARTHLSLSRVCAWTAGSDLSRVCVCVCGQTGLIYREQRLVNWDAQLKSAISDLEVPSSPRIPSEREREIPLLPRTPPDPERESVA